VDPAEALATVADAAAESEAGEQDEPPERAAAVAEHEARAQDDGARRVRERGAECLLPGLANEGREPVAEGRVLVADE